MNLKHVLAKRKDPYKKYAYSYLEDSVVDGQQRHIEGSTTKIEDQDVLLSCKTISLENNFFHFQTRIEDNVFFISATNGSTILCQLCIRTRLLFILGGKGDVYFLLVHYRFYCS